MIPRILIMPMAGIAFMSSTVSANTTDNSAPEQVITLGLGTQNAPAYSGSDKRRTNVVPILQARQGALFFDSLKGIGYDLQDDNGLYLEHTLGYSLGRSDRDSNWRPGSDKLKGMGNIKAALNTSLAVGWHATTWLSLEGKATLPLSDGQGGQYQAGVTILPWQGESDTLVFESAAQFGDRRYMKTFYGVNDRQSARSGYSRYQPGGGMYGVENDLTWSHQFSPNWATMVSASYTWLNDHVANSPIVFRRNQASASAAILYTF